MMESVVKICDLWHGRVFKSPQPARGYCAKGISPTIGSDRRGGDREIKFLAINEMDNRADARQQGQCGELPRGKDMAVRGGRMQPEQVAYDSGDVRLRYALGRTNHDPDGGYGTSKFHANEYFNTVTAVQMSDRRQWIAELYGAER